MKKHWSYQLSIVMMGIMTCMFILSFFLSVFITSKEFVVINFYYSSLFFSLLTLTLLIYSIFLIYYIKFLFINKKKEKLGSAFLHIGILFFLIFGILHKIDYFYNETKILMQEEKLYEINDYYYVQWKKREERLAIIENKENQFHIVQKIPIYADKISKWNHFQVKQMDKEPFVNWIISTGEQQLFSIFFNNQQVIIDHPSFEILEFFPTYEIVDHIPINKSNKIIKPAFLLYDHLFNDTVWVSEDNIIGITNAKVTKQSSEYLGILVVKNKLIPIFILAASFFTMGYVLLLITNGKKRVQK